MELKMTKKLILMAFILSANLHGICPTGITASADTVNTLTTTQGCMNCDLTSLQASQVPNGLQGYNLTLSKLNCANLSGVNLSNVTLENAIVHYANLSNANLSGQLNNINGVDFTGSNLSSANLQGADFTNSSLYSTNLTNANFASANLTGVGFGGANLQGANFNGATLENLPAEMKIENISGLDTNQQNLDLRSATNVNQADFTNAIMTGVNLSGMDLNGFKLSGANLSNANLSNTKNLKSVILLPGLILTGSNSTGVNGVTDLSGTDLSNMKLDGLNFSNVKMQNVNFSNSSFNGTNLTGADLTGSTLTGAKDLNKAILTGATFTNIVAPGAAASNIPGLDLSTPVGSASPLNLQGLQFGGANLVGVNFSGSDLTGAYLSGARLNEMTATATNFSKANLANAVTDLSTCLYANFASASYAGTSINPSQPDRCGAPTCKKGSSISSAASSVIKVANQNATANAAIQELSTPDGKPPVATQQLIATLQAAFNVLSAGSPAFDLCVFFCYTNNYMPVYTTSSTTDNCVNTCLKNNLTGSAAYQFTVTDLKKWNGYITNKQICL